MTDTAHSLPSGAEASEEHGAGPARPDAESSAFLPAWGVYLASTALTAVSLVFMMRLWRADWSAPFYFSSDAVSSAAHFRTTMDTGWYEYTAKLGAPYGQHYHDYPFSDDLHPAIAKFLGLFTDQVSIAVNVYYVLGFILVALSGTWFLRRCGLSQAMTIAMAVLYALAPYHFVRNETHLFLAAYYCVPLALGVVLQAISGKPLWGRRPGHQGVRGLLTGPGAVTVASLVLVTLSAAYYAVFTAVLLAAAGLFAFVRDRAIARLAGVAAGGVVLVGTLFAAMLPDILYARANGSVGAFLRNAAGSEVYAFKFTALIMPSPDHRIPAFAAIGARYANDYPLPGERPALGLVAAVGFVILLLVIPLVALVARGVVSPTGRRLHELSFLTVTAFMTGTIGGFGSLVSLFLTDSIRGWSRISIFIALLSLAAFGLVLDIGVRRLRRSVTRLGRVPLSVVSVAVASLVLLVGLADQSLKIAVPAYSQTAAEWNSGETFVQELSGSVPAGSMIFQLPYMAFPESGAYNGVAESEQLKLYLHNSDLRWSGGGIKGRPQSDWPATVAGQDAATMTRNLAMIGFEGIVVDRAPLADNGAQIEGQLQPLLGDATFVSPDQRYAYYSMRPVTDQVLAETTADQRAAIAAQITGIEPGN